jgi:hypothetical protein
MAIGIDRQDGEGNGKNKSVVDGILYEAHYLIMT